MIGTSHAQKRILALLLDRVLSVPHVFDGAMPYADKDALSTRYPYLAAKAVAGRGQILATRTATVRAVYGLVEKDADSPAGDSTPEQMGEYMITLVEKAQGAIDELAGNLDFARVLSITWSVEQRISRPYWHLLLDFEVELPSRPLNTYGFLT